MKITRRHLRRIIKEEMSRLLEQESPEGLPAPVEPGHMQYTAEDPTGNTWRIDGRRDRTRDVGMDS